MNATYSPEDNKLRLYAGGRLDPETYARVKAAGFIWAPKQELFVAPMWTPSREDLLIDLCGEIGDEDTSLVDRAEERAERFEDYGDKRREDAEQARSAVSAIADNIPMGQPILVGHHSEKHARKDAEKIENGMRRAVMMWETSKYWESRAAGAIRNAKYKERPDVRARRIKGLEAEVRKLKAEYTPDPKQRPIMQQDWHAERDAPAVPHVWCGQGRGGHWVAEKNLAGIEKHNSRWIVHLENRLIYERAMLADGGGLAAERFNIELGGKVLVRGEWVVILKINKAGGKINSFSTNRRYVSQVSIEEVKDYQPPEEGQAEKVKKAMSLPPLCNYPGAISVDNRYTGEPLPPATTKEMTRAEWDKIYKDSKGSRIVKATETACRHRVRITVRGGTYQPVYITDEKRKDPPAPDKLKADPVQIDAPIPVMGSRPDYKVPEPTEFDAMKDTLKAGIKVVSAPQLFPTPPDIAARMVELAEIEPDHRVLEPSAGTGNILRAIGNGPDKVAVEINHNLFMQLAYHFPISGILVIEGDFLQQDGNLGTFDRIVMNPPFTMGEDIKHIQHARTMLKPGGRLVALCANGSRQRAAFMDEAEHWEDLPTGSFSAEGTGVNVALMVLVAPDA